MPFLSKRQQRFMYASKPKGVDLEEWAEKTNFKKLPEKVRKKKDKGDALDLNPIPEDPFTDSQDAAIDGAGLNPIPEDPLNPQPEDPFKANAALKYASIYYQQVKLLK